MAHNLQTMEDKYVLNYVMFRLADALGERSYLTDAGIRSFEVDLDEILDRALEAIRNGAR